MARVRHRSDVGCRAAWGSASRSRSPLTTVGSLQHLPERPLRSGTATRLRPGWRPVHTTGVFVSGSFTAIGRRLAAARADLPHPSPPASPGHGPVLQLRPPSPVERSVSRSPWPGGAPAPAGRCDDGSRCDVHGPIHGVDTWRLHRGVPSAALPLPAALDPAGVADPCAPDPVAPDRSFSRSHHAATGGWTTTPSTRSCGPRERRERTAAGAVPVATGGRSASADAMDEAVQVPPLPRARARRQPGTRTGPVLAGSAAATDAVQRNKARRRRQIASGHRTGLGSGSCGSTGSSRAPRRSSSNGWCSARHTSSTVSTSTQATRSWRRGLRRTPRRTSPERATRGDHRARHHGRAGRRHRRVDRTSRTHRRASLRGASTASSTRPAGESSPITVVNS